MEKVAQHVTGYRALTDYYRDLMCFDQGDEVVQVGNVSLATLERFAGKRLSMTDRRAVRRVRHARPLPDAT